MKIRLLVVLALSLVIGLGAALQAQTSSDVTTFIKTYANFLKNVQLDQTPEDVQATSDGGYILLSASYTLTQHTPLYVVKTDSNGLCSSGCSEIYPVTQPTATDVSLTPTAQTLAVDTNVTPGIRRVGQTQGTTAMVTQDCD